MKSLLIVSMILTACGMQKTDQAIADKISAYQVPATEKADPSIDAARAKSVPQVTEIAETKKSIDGEIPAPAGVTIEAVQAPVEIPSAPQLMRTKTCETYNMPSVNFKMVTEFYDDNSRKNTIMMWSNNSPYQTYIPSTVITQQFTGLEAPEAYLEILIPMNQISVQTEGLTGTGNMWRIEMRVQDISEPVMYYGAKAGPTGTTYLGLPLTFGGSFGCHMN